MCGFGIVESGLVSGSYSGGGASDINTLKPASPQFIQALPHREHPVLGFSISVCSAVHVIGC